MIFKKLPELTDDVRARSKAYAKSHVSLARLWQFPATTIVDILHGHGIISLEAVRFWNSNKHRPGAFWKYTVMKHHWYPINVWRRMALWAYSKGIGKTNDRLGYVVDKIELVEYIATMKLKKGTYRKGSFWYAAEPLDYVLNREIIPPGKLPTCLNGATGIRCDDDFFVCAILPYRFRGMTIQDITGALWPATPVSEMQFMPDSVPD